VIPLQKNKPDIQCYLLNGKFTEKNLDNFESIIDQFDVESLYNMPVEAIIKILSALGKELIKNKALLTKEGIYYLATWLRESNLNNYISINCKDKTYLDDFKNIEKDIFIRAQPRGLVCHWIAGNVPTLAVLSLIQSIIAKNTNIVRVPKEVVKEVVEILKPLQNVSINYKGKNYSGGNILKSFSIIYFPSENLELNKQFSLLADCKVIWGGKDAVASILKLPQREHCENIVFGPKYSFSVVDEKSVAKQPDLLKKMIMDIILFQQNACSSSHVIFYELKDRKKIKDFTINLGESFEEVSRKYPKPKDTSFSDILNIRGKYLLDPDKDVESSKELDWTILSDNELRLEEPIKSRTVFVKPIDSALDVIPLITPKIQTIGLAISDQNKLKNFCEKATFKGVSRCVPVGSMNDYDTPWDGLLFIDRLVRWTLMRR